MSKTIFKKDDEVEGQTVADFKSYYRANQWRLMIWW